MNEEKSKEVLINNLKSKIAAKKDYYNELLYKSVIYKIANDLYPIKKDDMIDVSNLPSTLVQN